MHITHNMLIPNKIHQIGHWNNGPLFLQGNEMGMGMKTDWASGEWKENEKVRCTGWGEHMLVAHS